MSATTKKHHKQERVRAAERQREIAMEEVHPDWATFVHRDDVMEMPTKHFWRFAARLRHSVREDLKCWGDELHERFTPRCPR